jgi:hypothetical protein
MDRMTANQRRIYLATYAMVHGMLMGSRALRSKPIATARLAREHALAAVEIHRTERRK